MATVAPEIHEPTVPVADGLRPPGRSPRQLFWARFKQDRVAIAGLVLHRDPLPPGDLRAARRAADRPRAERALPARDDRRSSASRRARTGDFWFGADNSGPRRLRARRSTATRVSLIVGVVATGIAVFVGVDPRACSAGFFGGWADTLRLALDRHHPVDPLLLFAIGIVAACSIAKEGCLDGTLKPGLALVIFDHLAVHLALHRAHRPRQHAVAARDASSSRPAGRSGPATSGSCSARSCRTWSRRSSSTPRCSSRSNILFEAYLSFLGLGVPDDHALVGEHDQPTRPPASTSPGGSCSSRASSCCSRCWPSTCSATACATRSTRGATGDGDPPNPTSEDRHETTALNGRRLLALAANRAPARRPMGGGDLRRGDCGSWRGSSSLARGSSPRRASAQRGAARRRSDTRPRRAAPSGIGSTDFDFTDDFDPTGEYFGNACASTPTCCCGPSSATATTPARRATSSSPTSRPRSRADRRRHDLHLHAQGRVKFGPPVNRAVTSKDIEYAIERDRHAEPGRPVRAATTRVIKGFDGRSRPGRPRRSRGIETPDDKTIIFT